MPWPGCLFLIRAGGGEAGCDGSCGGGGGGAFAESSSKQENIRSAAVQCTPRPQKTREIDKVEFGNWRYDSSPIAMTLCYSTLRDLSSTWVYY